LAWALDDPRRRRQEQPRLDRRKAVVIEGGADNGREGPVAADISPYPAGDGLQFRQDLDGRVVGMDAPGAKDASFGPEDFRSGRELKIHDTTGTRP
jgi:hypothetical protein